ncbi:Hypothetical_protein [Hexamita inflata]|uniref:Hypothetical_protein n=1 Tax=Hexamita inflata TaxID=28002 RepID=A0AA86N763_9EUKA|nr:Hypothetical protein HINF_LOCUS1790 [Hexamita inflata]
MALGGIFVTHADLNIVNCSFMPTLYNIGNQSSYLFSLVSQSTIILKGIAIVLGSQTNQQVLTQISSTNSNHFQFGGICSELVNSKLSLYQLLHEINQIYSTQFVSQSGYIVGAQSGTNKSINLSQICFSQQITSTSSFKFFGFVGIQISEIYFTNSNIQWSIQGYELTNVGTIGNQRTQILLIQNLNLSANVSQSDLSSSDRVSVLIGSVTTSYGCNYKIIDVIVQNSNISAYTFASGLIAFYVGDSLTIQQCQVSNSTFIIFRNGSYCAAIIGNEGNNPPNITNINLQDVTIQNCLIGSSHAAQTYTRAAGLIGAGVNSIFIITNCKIFSISIIGVTSVGIVFACNFNLSNNFAVTNSISYGNNYVNYILQLNCANLSNPLIQKGC